MYRTKVIEQPVIVQGIPVQKVRQPGRPHGIGKNLDLLRALKAGSPNSCIFNVSKEKWNSLRQSAHKQGIEIITRKMENGRYSIWAKPPTTTN